MSSDMKTLFAASGIAVTLATAGCDVDVNETATPTNANDGVDVQIDDGGVKFDVESE